MDDEAKKEKGRQATRDWRVRNREALNARRRASRAANPEETRAIGRAEQALGRLRNPEKAKTAAKAYYARTRESRKSERNAASRNYYHAVLKVRPGFMASQSEKSRAKYRLLRDAACVHLGSVCTRCGFTDARALQIDHVEGGGKRELASLENKAYLEKVLVSVPGVSYQLLCANCNWIKRVENDEVPRRYS